ncbi:MAG: hypothetical protein RIC52_02155, partial [Amphiplicatus sp.]
AISPIGAGEVGASLLVYMIVYAIVFSAGAVYILRVVAHGPEREGGPLELPSLHAPGNALAAAEDKDSEARP